MRGLIRKKRQERKERKERKYASKFQQIVIEAQHAAATSMLDKPGMMSETKFHRLSYQVSNKFRFGCPTTGHIKKPVSILCEN